MPAQVGSLSLVLAGPVPQRLTGKLRYLEKFWSPSPGGFPPSSVRASPKKVNTLPPATVGWPLGHDAEWAAARSGCAHSSDVIDTQSTVGMLRTVVLASGLVVVTPVGSTVTS